MGTVECVLQFASNAQHRGVLCIETVTIYIEITPVYYYLDPPRSDQSGEGFK